MQEILSVYLIRASFQSVIRSAHLEKNLQYEGIPTFAPEHFARVRLLDSMKRKQFVKGINQIAQEGAIQIFQELIHGVWKRLLSELSVCFSLMY